VESPSLEIFQPRLAAVLCPLLWVTLLGQGVGLGDPRGPCPPLPCWASVILSSPVSAGRVRVPSSVPRWAAAGGSSRCVALGTSLGLRKHRVLWEELDGKLPSLPGKRSPHLNWGHWGGCSGSPLAQVLGSRLTAGAERPALAAQALPLGAPGVSGATPEPRFMKRSAASAATSCWSARAAAGARRSRGLCPRMSPRLCWNTSLSSFSSFVHLSPPPGGEPPVPGCRRDRGY